MIWNDTSTRQGLVQDMEDICGLGATGITGDSALFQQFTRWANIWAKKGAAIAINAMDGWTFDDASWLTYPSGTYAGQTTRDYVFAGSLKLLKIKTVGISYDGETFNKATPVDWEKIDSVKEDADIDSLFSQSAPQYDPVSNAINIYPKFTAAEVAAGASVYVEFYREPKEFATSGTDTQEPGLASPFHEFISKGASLEYCSLYKPEVASALRIAIYGNARAGIPGILKDMTTWYNHRYPRRKRMTGAVEDTK